MYVDRILYPVHSLGPGERLVIWFSGCSRRCPGCANPELQTRNPRQKIEADVLMRKIYQLSETRKIDGITLTGGEPLDQSDELSALLPMLRRISNDILVYSGYTLAEIQADSCRSSLLQWITALIDSPYIESLNDGITPLRGSTNQTLHIFDTAKQATYDNYLAEGRLVQNFIYGRRVMSVGIHKLAE